MVAKNYCIGDYDKTSLYTKEYLACLLDTRGILLRHSNVIFKTATLARLYALEWAKRVNNRARGRYPILTPIESILRDLKNRHNIYFEDVG